jgi:serine/threonine protein kinase
MSAGALRAGDVLNGYRLLEDFRVVGAGLSEWTFVERAGHVYFMKRFLSPTYPDDAAPGSLKTKARKRARCAAFEAHHRGIQAAMAPLTSYGGNLIATLDFFRDGAKYYKVTEKVDLAGLEPADVSALPFSRQLVLLKTVAHSLKILHDLRIVHSDLKPSNVLIKRTELGYTTKLIDFDSSYLVGNPPPPEDIVGTLNYYSPELVRYVQGTAHPGELTAASDIFSLGLIYTEYLTGAMPPFDPANHEAATAVLHGEVLHVPSERAPATVTALVDRMLAAEPLRRPTIGEIHAELMGLRSSESTAGRAPLPARRPTIRPSGPAVAAPSGAGPSGAASSSSAPSALRGKGLRLTGRAAPAPDTRSSTPASPPGTGTSTSPGLLGRLVGRRKKSGPA